LLNYQRQYRDEAIVGLGLLLLTWICLFDVVTAQRGIVYELPIYRCDAL